MDMVMHVMGSSVRGSYDFRSNQIGQLETTSRCDQLAPIAAPQELSIS